MHGFETSDMELVLLKRVDELDSRLGSTNVHSSITPFREYGRDLWAICRESISYWSPARLDNEALRRAADGNDSTLAALTARLTSRYVEWTVGTSELEANFVNESAGVRLLSIVRERIKDCLDLLERRATNVDLRALDLRLRFDHRELVKELFGRQLRSEVQEAIRIAATSTTTDEQLRKILSRIDALDQNTAHIENINKEVTFIADQATNTLAKELRKPALAGFERLGSIATSLFTKFVVEAVKESLKP